MKTQIASTLADAYRVIESSRLPTTIPGPKRDGPFNGWGPRLISS